MTNTETAALIRKTLKTAGIKASVTASRGSSVRVVVKEGSVSEAKRLAGQFESIRRCETTGEILCGGNLYVFVDADSSAVSARTSELWEQFGSLVEGLAEGNGVTLTGLPFTVFRNRGQSFGVVQHDGTDNARPINPAMGARGALETVARMHWFGERGN